jgi:hypothetical protein
MLRDAVEGQENQPDAVAGRTRNEVDRHVRDSFRIDDTGGLLDDVFGGDSPGTSWGRRPL